MGTGKVIGVTAGLIFGVPLLIYSAVFGVGSAPVGTTTGVLPPKQFIPLYVVAGDKYHVSWWWLATINRIETDYNRDDHTSPTGAEGPMQFEPSTWLVFGENVMNLSDESRYGNPNNFVDAVFASAKDFHSMGMDSRNPSTLTPENLAKWAGSYNAGVGAWDNLSTQTTQYRQDAVSYSHYIKSHVVVPAVDERYWESLPIEEIWSMVQGQKGLYKSEMPQVIEMKGGGVKG